MFWNSFLLVIIYLTGNNAWKDIHMPLCPAWRTNGTVIAGSKNGQSGTDAAFLRSPSAVVAAGENDILYVVDSGNNRIMMYENGSIFGKQLSIPGKSNDRNLSKPQDIAIDKAGRIYISEGGKNRVVRWTLNSSIVKIVVTIRYPTGIQLDEDNNDLYVVGLHDDSYYIVLRCDLKNFRTEKVAGNQYPNSLVPLLSCLYSPVGIDVDKHQRVYVAESGSHRITRWSSGRSYGEQIAGTGNCNPTFMEFCAPASVIVNDNDEAYFADTGKNRILHYIENVSPTKCLLGCDTLDRTIDQLAYPYDITFDSKLNFLVVERNLHRVQRYDFYYEFACMVRNCRPPVISIGNHPSYHIRSKSTTFSITATLDCHIWRTTDMDCKVSACFPGDLICIETSKLNATVNSFLVSDSFDMTIPPFGLPVGVYHFSCMIIMRSTKLASSIETTLQIIRPPVTITLLPLGKSKITLGYQQKYIFTPKVSPSQLPEQTRFVYYCRKHQNLEYTTVEGRRLDIDDDGKKPSESTCFNLKASPNSYSYGDITTRSTLTLMSQSLQINQIYEFYVEMYNEQGLVDKSDTVLLEIQLKDAFFIEVSTKFHTLTLDNDYQLLNPTTQLVLRSSCINSTPNTSIQWKIYTGTMDKTSTIVWTEYTSIAKDSTQWLYGVNSAFFTATKYLFSTNKNITYWQFEVVYSTKEKNGSGSVQLKTNYPPVQEYCSINPKKGNTSQLFTITCQNWTDLDGIQNYFLHVISSKSEIIMSIAHSIEPMFSVHLPSGDPKTGYELKLVVHVRDKLRACTESIVMQIEVQPDTGLLNETFNFTDDFFANDDRNQLINLYATILNQMTLDDQAKLMNNSQVQISQLMISTFETQRTKTLTNSDTTSSTNFIENLAYRSILRESLLNFYQSISVSNTTEEIIILSSTINQLTDTTSEWTQASLTIASKVYHQLSKVLDNISLRITIEEVILIANSLIHCTSNVFTGSNAPLQRRGFVFDENSRKDSSSDQIESADEEEYVDYELLDIGIPFCNYSRLKKGQVCREIVIDEDNSTMDVYHDDLTFYKQKVLADALRTEIEATIVLVGKSIRRHLNIHQDSMISYPALRMLIEQINRNDIQGKQINLQTRNASIYLPKTLSLPQSNQLGVQTTLLPLAPAGGNANVSFSTALVLSVLDDDDEELVINTTDKTMIEIFIPREINLPIPVFVEQKLKDAIAPKSGTWKINRQFFIYYVNITQINPNLTISIHLEFQPVDRKISYSIIYAFDRVPAHNSTDHSIDGSTMFCSTNLTVDKAYFTYYVDNIETAGHQSLFFGIRELGKDETCSMNSLPQITDQPYKFFSNHQIRIYSSGCYYLDNHGYWKSYGMKVGPKTNFEYTHCYSNHT